MSDAPLAHSVLIHGEHLSPLGDSAHYAIFTWLRLNGYLGKNATSDAIRVRQRHDLVGAPWMVTFRGKGQVVQMMANFRKKKPTELAGQDVTVTRAADSLAPQSESGIGSSAATQAGPSTVVGPSTFASLSTFAGPSNSSNAESPSTDVNSSQQSTNGPATVNRTSQMIGTIPGFTSSNNLVTLSTLPDVAETDHGAATATVEDPSRSMQSLKLEDKSETEKSQTKENVQTLVPAAPRTTAVIPHQMQRSDPKYIRELDGRLNAQGSSDPGPKTSSTDVFANYVAISKWPQKIYDYSVLMAPVVVGVQANGQPKTASITKTQVKKRIFATLAEHAPLQGAIWATDYESIYSIQPLWIANEGDVFTLGAVQYHRQDGRIEEIKAPVVKLKFNRRHDLPPPGPNGKFTLATTDLSHRERIVAALNAFITKYVKDTAVANDVVQVSTNKFFARRYHAELGQNHDDLLAYRGFSTSVRPSEDQILLNIAPLTSAFYRPITVHQWITNLAAANFGNTEVIMRTLVGVTCRLMYERPRHHDEDPNPNLEANRTKVITEFGRKLWANPPQEYQSRADNSLGRVQNLYRTILPQINNADAGSFCVNVGMKLKWTSTTHERSSLHREENPGNYSNFKEAIWIPAALLEICPHQIYSKLLDGSHQENMIDVACKQPGEVRFWIEQMGLRFLGITGNPPAAWMNTLGLRIGTSLIRVTAALVQRPKLQFNGGFVRQDEIDRADWNLRNRKFMQPATVSAVHFIRIVGHPGGWCRDKTGDHQHNKFNSLLAKQFDVHGIRSPMINQAKTAAAAQNYHRNWWNYTTNPIVKTIMTDPDNQAVLERDVEAHLKTKAAERPQPLCIVILPTRNPPPAMYAAVKRAGDFYGIRTMCAKSDKVDGIKKGNTKINEQYVSNLCLKINAKAGLDVHNVDHFTKLKDTIVLGADIGSAKGSPLGTPSVAAVVGTVDKQCMNMPGSMRLIPMKKTLIPHQQMAEMVAERLIAYAVKNGGKLPRNILMYRDGVSQSEYITLLQPDGELEAIKAGYDKALKGRTGFPLKDLKITFIVVGKRHNTRFFPTHDGQCVDSTNKNLIPGMVIANTVTLPNTAPVVSNFFLQSHRAIKGTARTAHYVVLRNDIGISDKDLREITLGFCYAFTRATKGVSYCAPAYHADRLCTRGQDYMRKTIRVAQGQPWWGTPPQQPTDAQLLAFFEQVAAGMATSPEWLSNGAATVLRRLNPWHPTFDVGMFYI